MTLVELRAAVRGAERRWQDERERDLIQVWRGLQLQLEVSNTKKLLPLEVVLARTRERAEKGALQMSDLAMLGERIGIPLRPASPEAMDALRRMRES